MAGRLHHADVVGSLLRPPALMEGITEATQRAKLELVVATAREEWAAA